jgi:hypothetical protein
VKNIRKIPMPVIPNRNAVKNCCTGLNKVIVTAIMKYTTNKKMRVCILLSISVIFSMQISAIIL